MPFLTLPFFLQRPIFYHSPQGNTMNRFSFSVCRALPVALFLLFFGVLLAAPCLASAGTAKVPAPRFALPSAQDGKTVSLDDHRGKVILINFWATWCGPCRMEVPSLVKLQEQYASKGFTVIGVSMDEGGAKAVDRFIKKNGINYPVVMGDSKIARDFGGVAGIPYSFLVDRSGTIVTAYPGLVEGDQIEADLKKLL